MQVADDIYRLAEAVISAARAKSVMVVTAESCTGGLVSAALTAVPGSSDVLDRGLVTYSYAAKSDLLGVSEALLRDKGAVCAEVAQAMAKGALTSAPLASVSVAITGIAGPGGGSSDKPVGLVWFASARRGREPAALERRFGDLGRDAVRHQATLQALELLLLEIRAE